jgi:hypothetical protein
VANKASGAAGCDSLTLLLVDVLHTVGKVADCLHKDPVDLGFCFCTRDIDPFPFHLTTGCFGSELSQLLSIVDIVDELLARQQCAERKGPRLNKSIERGRFGIDTIAPT